MMNYSRKENDADDQARRTDCKGCGKSGLAVGPYGVLVVTSVGTVAGANAGSMSVAFETACAALKFENQTYAAHETIARKSGFSVN